MRNKRRYTSLNHWWNRHRSDQDWWNTNFPEQANRLGEFVELISLDDFSKTYTWDNDDRMYYYRVSQEVHSMAVRTVMDAAYNKYKFRCGDTATIWHQRFVMMVRGNCPRDYIKEVEMQHAAERGEPWDDFVDRTSSRRFYAIDIESII